MCQRCAFENRCLSFISSIWENIRKNWDNFFHSWRTQTKISSILEFRLLNRCLMGFGFYTLKREQLFPWLFD
jgi:hypothetical protein